MLRSCKGGLYLLLIFINSHIQSADVTYSGNTTLSADLKLSSASRAIFNATMTLNGAGFFFDFPVTSDIVFIVNPSFTATLQNLFLRNFSDANVSLSSGSSLVFGDKSVVQILFDQSLTHTLNFSGNSVILGNNNILDLGVGSISVKSNSNLTISNLNLINITSLNLGCIDNTGSITFENVSLSIPSRLNWSNGSFLISRKVEVCGGVFAYTSGMSSTISSASKLIFSKNLNFSYDPIKLSGQSIASKTNLAFTDTSSWLILNKATLTVTNTGMHLLKGSLGIVGKNSLYSDATLSASQGLCLGDGINLSNNLNITSFNSTGASIDVKQGKLTYQNIE